jgi:hypothetical protein
MLHRLNLLVVGPARSNEIAGDGAVPHPCIGSSRRVMVPRRELQHEVLLGAVQNLSPDVVICDEISDHKVSVKMHSPLPPCVLCLLRLRCLLYPVICCAVSTVAVYLLAASKCSQLRRPWVMMCQHQNLCA